MSGIENESGIDFDGFMSSANEFLDGKVNPKFKFYTDEVIDKKVLDEISGGVKIKKNPPLDDYIEIINGMNKISFMQGFLDPDGVRFLEGDKFEAIETKYLKAFKLDLDINKKTEYTELLTNFFGGGISEIARVAEILNCLGFKKSSVTMLALLAKLAHVELRKPINEEVVKRTAISDRNRAAGKGNINKNKELVIKIAKSTWEKYPNASLGGLRDEVYEYLTRNNITARPSMATINDWLKKSTYRPSAIKTNRDFVLIVD